MRLGTRYRSAWICLGLVAAVVAVYGPAAHFGFVDYDDDEYVYRNPHLALGLTAAGLRWAFTTGYAANYHPLVWASFLFDRSAWGLRPGPMHVENLCLHAANAVLLFALFGRARGGRDGAGPPSPWPAAVAAAIFAVHPAHVESVAWVTERKDVLSMFFMLLSIAAYVRYTAGRRPGAWYAAMLVAYAAALLAKQMPVTLAAVLLLMDVWPLRRVGRVGWPRLVAEKVPLVAMAIAASAATVAAQSAGGAVVTMAGATPYQRASNAGLSYVAYLGSAVWPANLSPFYPFRRDVPPAVAVGAAAVVVGATVAAVWAGRRWRRAYVPVGWLWFVGTLVPVIGLVQVGDQSMADRYLYVPLVGLGIVAAWGTWDLGRAAAWAPVVAGLWAVALLELGIAARRQVGYWADSDQLRDHAALVINGESVGRVRIGETALARHRPAEAERQFRLALAADPANAVAHFDLGNLLHDGGRDRVAFDEWARAADLDPTLAAARYNMGAALAATGNRSAAAALFADALRIDPAYAPARRALAALRD